jgi:hypothetical protein
VGYGADVFIIGHEDSGEASYTTDAHNWTPITDSKLTSITGIAYGAGTFVMVGAAGDNSAIAYSTPE